MRIKKSSLLWIMSQFDDVSKNIYMFCLKIIFFKMLTS